MRGAALSEPQIVQVRRLRAHLLPVRRLAPAGTLVDRYRRRSSTRGRGGAVLASPVANNSDIDIFVGGTPANETIVSLFSRDASSAGGLWDLSDALGLVLARLPGDVLLAGLMAVYTKNGIFASLFILHSVSAAPKPWYYALYVPGSGWGVFSTWDLCAAHGAIGGSRARHKKYRNIQEALEPRPHQRALPNPDLDPDPTRLLVPV